MNNKTILMNDERSVKVLRRGIAQLVTYTDKQPQATMYGAKTRYIWPDNFKNDSRYITKRVYGQGGF